MAYYLGIDGGGSKTSCAVGDDVSLLATVTAGPSNITRVGEARARESLHQAIHRACSAAKIASGQIERACIGVAGAGRQEIASAVRKIVAEVIAGEIQIVGDMHIALEAAFGPKPGVIVIAGTGSIAYGRNAQGKTARAGGWGFAISDEGSAHWIGRTAVTALLRAIDQRTEPGMDRAEDFEGAADTSPLFREMSAVWKVHSLDQFVRTANSNPDFAVLFPAILAAADVGDALAERVLAKAGAELLRLARIVVTRLFTEQDASSPAVRLAMVGGVFRYSPRVRGYFCDEVRKLNQHLDLNPEVVDPVAGALQAARQGGALKLK